MVDFTWAEREVALREQIARDVETMNFPHYSSDGEIVNRVIIEAVKIIRGQNKE